MQKDHLSHGSSNASLERLAATLLMLESYMSTAKQQDTRDFVGSNAIWPHKVHHYGLCFALSQGQNSKDWFETSRQTPLTRRPALLGECRDKKALGKGTSACRRRVRTSAGNFPSSTMSCETNYPNRHAKIQLQMFLFLSSAVINLCRLISAQTHKGWMAARLLFAKALSMFMHFIFRSSQVSLVLRLLVSNSNDVLLMLIDTCLLVRSSSGLRLLYACDVLHCAVLCDDSAKSTLGERKEAPLRRDCQAWDSVVLVQS